MNKCRLLSLPILFSAAIQAECDGVYSEEDCTPCYTQCCQSSSLGAGGHWLYMRPLNSFPQIGRRVESTEFANPIFNGYDWQELFFETEYVSGFDLYTYFRSPPSCDDFSLEVRGAFSAHRFDKSQVYETEIWSFLQPSIGFIQNETVNSFSEAKARWNTSYESIRGEFCGVLDRDGMDFLRISAGLEYTNINHNFSVLYTPVSSETDIEALTFTQVRELSRMSGIGPKVGFTGNIPLLCALSVCGDFSASLLFSKRTGSFEQETRMQEANAPLPESDLKLKDTFFPIGALTPSIRAQVGLRLDIDFWGCFSLEIDAGYRALYYWDALSHLAITTNNLFAGGGTVDFKDSSSKLQSLNYGLTGWVIGGSLQF